MLSFRYDDEIDAGYIAISSESVAETIDLEASGLSRPVLLDIDSSGRLVGIEILSVSETAPGLLKGC